MKRLLKRLLGISPFTEEVSTIVVEDTHDDLSFIESMKDITTVHYPETKEQIIQECYDLVDKVALDTWKGIEDKTVHIHSQKEEFAVLEGVKLTKDAILDALKEME